MNTESEFPFTPLHPQGIPAITRMDQLETLNTSCVPTASSTGLCLTSSVHAWTSVSVAA